MKILLHLFFIFTAGLFLLTGCQRETNRVFIDITELKKVDSKEIPKILESRDCTMTAGSEWAKIIDDMTALLKNKQTIMASYEYSLSCGKSEGRFIILSLIAQKNGYFVLDQDNNLIQNFSNLESAKAFIKSCLNKAVTNKVGGIRELKKETNATWNKYYEGKRYIHH